MRERRLAGARTRAGGHAGGHAGARACATQQFGWESARLYTRSVCVCERKERGYDRHMLVGTRTAKHHNISHNTY